MNAPTTTSRFESFDGVRLAVHDVGEGRPTVLLHGYLASAELNYVQPGIAAHLLAAGRRLIMPDLRGHGASDAPTEEAAYPPDVLARDAEAILARLDLGDYDLVGYSLGARTAARLLARGARPRRAVLAGMGDSGVTNPADRAAQFEAWLTGDPAADPDAVQRVQGMLAERGLSLPAMLGVLKSFVATTPAELAAVDLPVLVVSGARDEDNGSAEALAGLLPKARALRTPGNHLSAVAKPELAAAILAFLDEGR
jgi:pimeloyl-ACP methyl ester carboxylesterase